MIDALAILAWRHPRPWKVVWHVAIRPSIAGNESLRTNFEARCLDMAEATASGKDACQIVEILKSAAPGLPANNTIVRSVSEALTDCSERWELMSCFRMRAPRVYVVQ